MVGGSATDDGTGRITSHVSLQRLILVCRVSQLGPRTMGQRFQHSVLRCDHAGHMDPGTHLTLPGSHSVWGAAEQVHGILGFCDAHSDHLAQLCMHRLH